jgi:2-polyprenyl-3-methyl-5-hydroxy-6-metoxy-1,4-benzoquinol methylase
MADVVVSQMDVEHLKIIRSNVSRFVKRALQQYAAGAHRILDIAPHDQEGVAPHVKSGTKVDTLDINAESGATIIADICTTNDHIAADTYDCIVCTEVLEHTLQPFKAIEEMGRILKAGAPILISTPFNFRIHGPLPDCWRFTEHGLRALLSEFEIVELESVNAVGRDLMPIHYTTVARKIAR